MGLFEDFGFKSYEKEYVKTRKELEQTKEELRKIKRYNRRKELRRQKHSFH